MSATIEQAQVEQEECAGCGTLIPPERVACDACTLRAAEEIAREEER